MSESPSYHRQELVRVIQEVRRRWRRKLLVRGGVAIIGGGLLALVLASLALQTLRFSSTSVLGFRVAILAVFAGLVGWCFVRPLRRKVSDMQVALYVEEHDRSLQAAILSAVEVGGTEVDHGETPQVIIDRMVEQAIEKCRTLDGGRAVGRDALRRNAVVLGVLSAATVLLLIVGPEFLRQGASALLILSRSAEAASPYAITVTPGSVTIPKGADQSISAKLAGFRSNDVAIMVKAEGSAKFERMPLLATGDAATFEGMLFDIKKPIEYYVDSDGVSSPVYTMKVVELPAVEALEIEYVFPAYTGLPPQKIESGGDVAALRGTEVRVKVKSTMATQSGRLQLDPKSTSGLAPQADGTLTGSFKIDQDGYYHVELDGPHGEHVAASPKYTVDAIEDQPPVVTFEKPKRDTQANPVEEVFLQARANDDYGVKQLDLVYSVNGGPEKTVALYGKSEKTLKDVSAGHTVYMEELGVKPGDFVAYYAKAQDNDTVKGPKASTSDIYFVKIRPFNQNFKEAQSQQGGGGGGGGGQQNQVGSLSEQQRQIISATFNVERDKAKTPADKLKENTVFIGLAQSKLRDQVEELIQQMNQRVGATDELKKIVDVLPKAVEEMKAAEKQLQGIKTKEAMAPEQRALKYLQDAEQMYELEVRRRQQQGGGGGGGGGQMAEDLADLFEMQADKMANQYEQQQSASASQSAQQKIDEAADKLKELARRQLQQAERQRQAARQGQGAGSSAERALADEVEQLARELEQLQRNAAQQGQQRQDLADAQRRLQNAANQMREAAANGSQDGGAKAQQALQDLQQVQRQLQQASSANATQDVKNALQQARDLQQKEKEIASQVAGLDQAGAGKDAKVQQLSQDKTAMNTQLGALQQQLGQLGRQALAGNQRDAARKLEEAAGTISREQLKEKIEYSKQAMAAGSDYAKGLESNIGQGLDKLAQQVADAAGASDKAQQGNQMNRAVNQASNALRGMQTLQDQINQAGQNGQQGQQGQNGQQGQGQQGQGQQGQGQQGKGQQGQQGQGQQGQGQQGQGQQGQGQQGQGQPGQGQQGQGQQGQGQQGQGQQGQGQQGQGQQGQGQQGQGQQGQGQQGQGQGGQQGQGQGGQQGQGQGQGRPGQQQGQRTLNGQGGQASASASSPNSDGGDARPNGQFAPGDLRQIRNTANQLATDVQQVRQQMQQGGADATSLRSVDEVVKNLRDVGNEKSNADPRGLDGLMTQALDKMQKVEFELRKKADTENQQLLQTGTEEVPAQFQKSVASYFHALSKNGVAPAPAAPSKAPAKKSGGK